jgi:hypothetical protein
MVDEPLTVEQREARWRRQFQVFDDLIYGYLLTETERRAARARTSPWRRLRWRPAVWYRVVWRFWHTFPRLAEHFNERERDREARRRAERDPTVVTLADLHHARHVLSVPRFYPSELLREEHFQHSDPLDEFYVGRPEIDFVRVRSELDAEFG